MNNPIIGGMTEPQRAQIGKNANGKIANPLNWVYSDNILEFLDLCHCKET